MTTSSQPAASGAGSSKKPVVSHFFARPGPSAQAPTAKKPLAKKPSIIELSDSDASSADDTNDDDDLQVIERAPIVASKKRKSSPSAALKDDDDEGSAKKVKVAPLFNKAKVAQAAIKQEKTDAGQAKDKLSKWKFSPPSAAPPLPSALAGKSPSSPSSSSSLSLSNTAKKASDGKLEARRAEVRRKLLGVDFNRRPPEVAPVTEDGDMPMEKEEDDEPIASTSKLTAPSAKGKKGKTSATAEEGGSKNRFSKFAAGAASSEESDATTAKGKKRAATTAGKKGKGKGKEDAGVKYTPLEQQVLDIKAKYPDTLLIVEVGYKFKFFGDDAKIASKELNIACFMSQNFFTAMIPVHRLQVHIKRLITQGYKVGVVRQKETAALKKAGDNRSAPFTRELTNLYTAATYVEGLDDGSVTGAPPTFGTLLCLCEESRGGKGSDEKVSFGLVSAQPSTGEVIYDSFDDGFLRSELETRLLHIQPGELVIQGEISAPTNRVISYLLKQDAASTGLAQNRMEQNDKTLSYNKALKLITDFYGAAAKEPTDSPAKKKVKKHGSSKKKQKAQADSDEDTDMVDLTLMSSQEGPSEVLDEQEDNGDAGGALATILGLPERVVIALAGLLKHLTAFQLDSVFKRPKYFTPFAERGHMLLNANTVANLEIFRNQTNFKATGSLFSVLDHTKTPFGQRLLRRWVAKPLLQLDALRTRVDAVDEILNSESYLLGKMRGLLKGLPDLERGLARIHYGKSTPQELVRVLSAFQRIADEFPNLPKDLKQTNVGFKSDMVNDVFYALPALKPAVQEFMSVMDVAKAREGKKEDIFLMEFEPEEITDCKEVLMTVEAEFQQHLLECRKILKKPAAEYITVAQDEYLLEVRISESKIVPHDWLRINGTKAAYRYRSPKMQTLLDERDQANERLAAEADAAFLKFLASISAKYEAFRDVVTKLATIDCLISLSTVGLSQGYVKPELVDEPCLEIIGGRHPVVEQLMDTPFIPNDVSFAKDGLRAMVITGCNMSGKSSFSRMVALLVIMAQIGCHLPCESAKIGIVDYVGTRFGASDEIQRGRSTFMVELTETCEIIKAASPRSLIVLDELGRGTSTNDGLAIAHAVLEYVITTCRASTLFITHFPQLASLAAKYPVQCQLFQMAYMEDEGANGIPDITFLYKLVSGLTDRVHGISCARMAGLPASVCELAASKSKEIEDADHANLAKRKTQHIRNLFVALQNKDSAVNLTQIVQYARDLLSS